jgi:hypothetical protein
LTFRVSGFDVRIPVQEFVLLALDSDWSTVPLVGFGVPPEQPENVILAVVVSVVKGPVVLSGGENVIVPFAPLQVTVPVPSTFFLAEEAPATLDTASMLRGRAMAALVSNNFRLSFTFSLPRICVSRCDVQCDDASISIAPEFAI